MFELVSITRRGALALGAGALMAGTVGAAPRSHWAVAELFTSQGCSSCPPADAFMAELVGEPGVIALTFNVDYWDYLGWRDTLASSDHSQRQYDYAKSRGDMDVYTPQMVIDGRSHYVGSKKAAVRAALDRARGHTPARWVPMTIDYTNHEMRVSVEAADTLPAATLWVAAVAPKLEVVIEKGENAGNTIVYRNVVRKLVPAGRWHGEALTVSLSEDSLLGPGSTGCAALLQEGHVGPILGAAGWGHLVA